VRFGGTRTSKMVFITLRLTKLVFTWDSDSLEMRFSIGTIF
jgi:hypothetical protein